MACELSVVAFVGSSSLTREHPLHWQLGVLDTGPPRKAHHPTIPTPTAVNFVPGHRA